MFHILSSVSLNKPRVNNPIPDDGIVSNSYFVSAVSYSVQGGDQLKMVILDILVTG